MLGTAEKVYTIEGFLEKVTSEYSDLAEYKVLSVHKSHFGKISLSDSFFNSIKKIIQILRNGLEKNQMSLFI